MRIADIVINPEIMPREKLREPVVKRYRDRMLAGEVFPPGEVALLDGHYVLLDGWHRLEAAKRMGLEEFDVEALDCKTLDAAVWRAAGANREHGLASAPRDLAKAIDTLSRHCPDKTNAAIAEQIGCSISRVHSVRTRLAGPQNMATKRKGKDGKYRPAKYARKTCRPAQSKPGDQGMKTEGSAALRLQAVGGEHSSPAPDTPDPGLDNRKADADSGLKPGIADTQPEPATPEEWMALVDRAIAILESIPSDNPIVFAARAKVQNWIQAHP
jgi:hypothetical protein